MADEILKYDIIISTDTKGVKELKENLNGVKSSATDAAGGIGKAESGSKKLSKTTTETAKNTEDFKEQLDKTGESMALTTEHIKVLVEAMVAMEAFKSVREDMDMADELGKTADRMGMTVETFTSLSHAASLAGVDTASFSTSLQFLNKNMADAATGTGSAYDAFKQLGISVKDASGHIKSTDQVLFEIADKIDTVKSSAEKTNIAMSIFGRSGAAMLTLLKDKSDGLRAAAQDAYATGDIVTSKFSKSAEEANDEIERMQRAFEAARREVSAELAPVMYELANQLKDVAIQYTQFLQTPKGQEQIKDFVEIAKDGAIVVGDLAKALVWLQETFGDSLPLIVKTYVALKAFGMVSSTFGGIAGKAGEVKESFDAVAGATAKMKSSFIETTTDITRDVTDTAASMGGLVNATRKVTDTYTNLTLKTVTMSEKLALLRGVLPELISVMTAGAVALYGGIKAGEYLTDHYNFYLTPSIRNAAKQIDAMKKSNDKWLVSLKETEKQLHYTAKSADDLQNMDKDKLADEYKTATKEAHNLAMQITALKFSEAPKSQIEELKKRLEDVNNYINTIQTKGFRYILSMDEFKSGMKDVEDITKKIGDDNQKNIDYLANENSIHEKELQLYNKVNYSSLLSTQYAKQRANVVLDGYHDEIQVVNSMIDKVEKYSNSEKNASFEVRAMAETLFQKRKELSQKTLTTLLADVDKYVQAEKQAKDKLAAIAQERADNEENFQNINTKIRQYGMTDEQKAVDNYQQMLLVRQKADSLYYQALQSTDTETRDKLIENADKFTKQYQSMAADSLYVFQNIGNRTDMQNMAGYVDEAQQKLNALSDLKASVAQQQLQTSQDQLKTIKDAIDYIQQLNKNVDLRLQMLGYDTVKYQYDSIHDKTVNVTIAEKTVQYRNSGGMIDYVPGSGNTDSVHLMATPGEFVAKKASVMNYGVQFFRDLNAMRIPKEQLYAAYRKVKPIPKFNLPSQEDIEIARQATIIERGGSSKPTETVVLEINLGGATLTARTTKDELAEYEKHARRMRLCIPKKR